jgi:predicted glycoside hydrolase/deacetylase ChbG (UPF0249 family)
MNQLIVNADDFGYSYGVNKGIIKAHTQGIVTSTSVLVDAIAAHQAKDLTQYADLSIGLHFELKEISNVQAELNRQVDKFVSIVGREPDHVDTHKKHPTSEGIKEVLAEYSRLKNVPVRGFGFAKFIDLFFGFHSNGDVSLAQLQKAIDQATDDYNELMCHVGYADEYLREHSSYNDPREQELAAICDPAIKQYIREKGVSLCSWKRVPVQEDLPRLY